MLQPDDLQKLGNESLLDRELTAFLCSRRTPESAQQPIQEWVQQLDPERDCILCGNHSRMEQAVFTWLLANHIPVVLVLAEAMPAQWGQEMQAALAESRMLVLTHCGEEVHMATSQSAADRNQLMLSLATAVVVGHCVRGGNVERQVAGRPDVTMLTPPSMPPRLEDHELLSYRLPTHCGLLFFDLTDEDPEPTLRITQSKPLSAGGYRRERITLKRSELLEFRDALDKAIRFWLSDPSDRPV